MVGNPVVVLSLAMLVRVEELIKRHALHDLAAPGPISLQPVLEEYEQVYRAMPYFVTALTLRWPEPGEIVTQFNYNDALQEPESTADRREAQAHEFAHVFCNHHGDHFIMWSRSANPRYEGLGKLTQVRQEHQCASISALLLVPMWMLNELEGNDVSYVAAVLDVPPHLAALRRAVRERFGR